MVSNVGRQPIRNVAVPITSSDATRVVLRPIRSPKCPKMIDPTGRAKNARANVTKDDSCEAVGSSFGKNSVGKTSTAAVA